MRTPRAHYPIASALAPRRRLAAMFGLACILAALVLAACPSPALAADPDPAQFLEQLRQQRKARAQESEQEFKRLVHQGQLLVEQRAYGQARSLLTRAQQLRPDDPTCRRLLAQVEANTGGTHAKNLLAAYKQEHNAKQHTHGRQLQHDLFNAQQALKAGRNARAISFAERVVAGAQYHTDTAAAAGLRTKAQAVLASARKAQATSREQKQKTELAAMRKRAARDQVGQLRTLREKGWKLHEKGKYDEALARANEMLRLAPGNKQAIFLREECRRAMSRGDDVRALRTDRKNKARDLLTQQIEDEMTVDKDIKAKVVLRGDKAIGGTPGVALDRPMDMWERRIRAKLREPLTAEFKQATVSDACRYLSQLADCPILVDPATERKNGQFSLPKMTVSFEHWLRWVCKINQMTFAVRDHAILVTTRQGGDLNRPVTSNYDVSGLLAPTRTIRTTFTGATQIDEQPTVAGATPATAPGAEGDESSKHLVGEGWVRFIKSTVAPESWGQAAEGRVLQEAPVYSINYRNGRIVVVHTPEVQREIEEMLNNFRRARNLQVHIFARFLQLDMDFLAHIDTDLGDTATDDDGIRTGAIGFDSDPNNNDSHPWSIVTDIINDDEIGGLEESVTNSGGLSLSYSFLKNDQVNTFLSAVSKHRKGTLLIAPRLTCFNTQRANFQAVTNFNYVRSISSDNEPEIGNVPDGIVFDVQPFVSADHRYITLVLQPQLRTLRSLVIFQYVGGGLRDRFIQIPTVELKSVATTVTVPDGGTVLVGGLAKADEAGGVASVPFLNGIPLLKYVLRSWTDSERRTSLVILVTAQVVPDIFKE